MVSAMPEAVNLAISVFSAFMLAADFILCVMIFWHSDMNTEKSLKRLVKVATLFSVLNFIALIGMLALFMTNP